MKKAMTLRLPNDLYEQLRREAFEKRTTITALILSRVGPLADFDKHTDLKVTAETEGWQGDEFDGQQIYHLSVADPVVTPTEDMA